MRTRRYYGEKMLADGINWSIMPTTAFQPTSSGDDSSTTPNSVILPGSRENGPDGEYSYMVQDVPAAGRAPIIPDLQGSPAPTATFHNPRTGRISPWQNPNSLGDSENTGTQLSADLEDRRFQKPEPTDEVFMVGRSRIGPSSVITPGTKGQRIGPGGSLILRSTYVPEAGQPPVIPELQASPGVPQVSGAQSPTFQNPRTGRIYRR